VNSREMLETTPPRHSECCTRDGCVILAWLRFDGCALCPIHFGRAFHRAANETRIEALVDLVNTRGYLDITWLGDVSLRQLEKASA
jgi:hypothetical protein